MAAQAWDDLNASAMKLGKDVTAIASQETRTFLENELFAYSTAKLPLIPRQSCHPFHGKVATLAGGP